MTLALLRLRARRRSVPCGDRRRHFLDVGLRLLHVGVVLRPSRAHCEPGDGGGGKQHSAEHLSLDIVPPFLLPGEPEPARRRAAAASGPPAFFCLAADRGDWTGLVSCAVEPVRSDVAFTADRRRCAKPASAIEITSVVPLNRGSTKKAPPSCWMPEMPTARISTPHIVPQTLTRPGLIVVEPRTPPPAPAAGSRDRRWLGRSAAWRRECSRRSPR